MKNIAIDSSLLARFNCLIIEKDFNLHAMMSIDEDTEINS
jgi:hypothetical protein